MTAKLTKKILLTGFEPFDGDSVNPSSVLLDWLKTQSFDFQLHTELLPVSFESAYKMLDQACQEFNPTHVIMTGLAKNRVELTLERIAINWVDARIPDNDGLTIKLQKIKESGEDGLFSTMPIIAMLESARRAGCSAKISTTAGEYVCNHLMYLYLFEKRTTPGIFIHLPGALDHEIFYQGISAILRDL